MFQSLVTVLFVVSTAQAGLINSAILVEPGEPGTLLEGPASKAAVIGPDGSTITAAGQAGAILAPPRPGGVITAAIQPGLVATTYPIAAPIAYATAPLAIAAPIPLGPDAVIAGPSGFISTGKGLYL